MHTYVSIYPKVTKSDFGYLRNDSTPPSLCSPIPLLSVTHLPPGLVQPKFPGKAPADGLRYAQNSAAQCPLTRDKPLQHLHWLPG